MSKRTNTTVADFDKVSSLLHAWEDLAAQRFQDRLPEIEGLLHIVSAEVASGQWHVTGWNPFEILGCVRREDTHSDTLAWLFTPWEAHGLGDRFLREFVREVYTESEKSLPNGRVHCVATRKTISPNGDKIDIEVQGDGWVLAVENKIDHIETTDQTERYAKHYRRLAQAGKMVFGVFLTLREETAGAADVFRAMSYSTLRGILDRMQSSTEGFQLVRWFADHIRKDLEVRR